MVRFTTRCSAAFLAVLAAGLWPDAPSTADARDLSKNQIARRGREATAFLEVGPGRSATAFCVHPSGLFVTNVHAIKNPSGAIKVVVKSGTLEQKVLTAKVVRRDEEDDLALLRVDNQENLPTLSLGSADELEELQEVFAFGFPFGRGPDVGSDQYPSISVNRGAISSLKRKSGRLNRIQLNAAVNPGNSGGPLLNSKGEVVGVIVGRVEGNFGAGIDVAIPVNLLERFLARPDVTFTADRSEAVDVDASVEFKATVRPLLPTKQPLDLQLVLAAGTPNERRVPLKQSGDDYRGWAIPFPAAKGPQSVEVVVTFADGAVKGRMEDRSIKVGNKDVKLSELEIVRFSPSPDVRTADGQRLEGKATPLKESTIRVGGQDVHLDLSTAAVIRTTDSSDTGAVSCALVTKLGSQEVTCASMPVFRAGALRPSFDALRDERFIRPARSSVAISYLRVQSPPGDWVGQGKTYSYEKDELTFQSWGAGGIRCQVGQVGNWTLLLGAGQGRNLQVGEYRDAKRHPFSGASPGIEFTGNGRGCNTISGAFRIWELEIDGNAVARLAVDFFQCCEGRKPPLVGMLRYNSHFH
jgi:hypothetical protein